MPKTRAEKEATVAALADKFGQTKSVVFTSISGYTMADADTLRSKGQEEGVELSITKKTMLLRALENIGVETKKENFEGSILTTFGLTDEVAPAKLISDFAKDRDGIEIIGGILEGKLVDADAIKTLAKLPSKQELLAKIVGSINAPRSGFVNVLAGNLRGFVYALNAIKESKV
jgi:large subunit ribosomal protein L10